MNLVLKILSLITCSLIFMEAQAQTIVINEFLAANDSTTVWVDENGEHDDWVELYNLTDQAVDLTGYYLSDSKVDFLKWQIPAGISIAANGYLIIWADDDDLQGDLHTNFKLNKAGDELTLSSPTEEVLDSITFGSQEANISLARIPNGTGDFTERAPTFNENNESSASAKVFINQLQVYPNPTEGQILIESDLSFQSIQVFDMLGNPVFQKSLNTTHSSKTSINLDKLTAGFYIIELKSRDKTFVEKVFLK